MSGKLKLRALEPLAVGAKLTSNLQLLDAATPSGLTSVGYWQFVLYTVKSFELVVVPGPPPRADVLVKENADAGMHPFGLPGGGHFEGEVVRVTETGPEVVPISLSPKMTASGLTEAASADAVNASVASAVAEISRAPPMG